MSVGKRLKDWRKEKKITTREICEKTGISTGAISNYENEKREIGVNLIIKLYEIYDIDLEYILTGVRKSKTENEEEMIKNFKYLPEREQIKIIGILEERAKPYKEKSETSSILETG